MMNWNENGIPTAAKLHELGLGWVVDLLEGGMSDFESSQD
jgi:hypothetical protein